MLSFAEVRQELDAGKIPRIEITQAPDTDADVPKGHRKCSDCGKILPYREFMGHPAHRCKACKSTVQKGFAVRRKGVTT